VSERSKDVVVQGMFLFSGYMSTEPAPDNGMGQIEAAHYLSHWADKIVEHIRKLDDANWDFPGVFEYEVTEDFGAYLRQHYYELQSVQWQEFLRLSQKFMGRAR
jgi:hypothetical protein